MTAAPASAAADHAPLLRPMRGDEEDLARFAACFGRNSDRPRSLESLRWQYFENPTGKVFVDVATVDEDRNFAAIYATLPGTVRVLGERRLAVQSLDTLTDADYRGRGLFVSLAKRTFERACEASAALVYGFPNANSAHGFFTKLGWVSLDPVPFLLRPLRTRYFATKVPARLRRLARFVPDLPLVLPRLRGSRLRLVPVERFDERATVLWSEFSTGVGVALERDAAYLDWRLRRKPGEQYRTLALEGDSGGLEALVSFAVKEKHGGRIGYVLELLHRPGGVSAGAHLLRTAVAVMADERADAVLAWCFAHAPNRAAYARCGFFPLPPRLRPIELHFGARAFDPTLAATVRDRSRWYVSYLDSDTV